MKGGKISITRISAPWQIKSELIVKGKEKTNMNYGSKPEERSPEEYIRYGVINLDKPPGPTSHEVAAWTKLILKINRVGHGGTLEAF